MKRLSENEWKLIQLERETKGTSFPVLAKTFGVSHQAIQKRAKAEGWGNSIHKQCTHALPNERTWGLTTSLSHLPKAPLVVFSLGWDKGLCEMCGTKISKKTRCAYVTKIYARRGARNCHVEAICPQCLLMETAELEAKINGWRYTQVSIAAHGSALGNYCGSRCACGAAALATKDVCVQCWRAQRMLSKAQAEIREIRLMTASINRQIKEQIKNGAQ